MGDGIWTGERYLPGMGTLGDFAGPAGIAAGAQSVSGNNGSSSQNE